LVVACKILRTYNQIETSIKFGKKYSESWQLSLFDFVGRLQHYKQPSLYNRVRQSCAGPAGHQQLNTFTTLPVNLL
jgi:hypothetical protein